MYEKLLKKIDNKLARLLENAENLKRNIRNHAQELDFEISKNDLEISVWQEIREVVLGNSNKLSLEDQAPYFFFPPEIGKLTNLLSLDISGNSLSKLPSEIWSLSGLLELNLSRNHFEILPAEIGQLNKLEILNINGNSLDTLPPEVGKLTNLKSLDLGENRLTALPPEIGLLKKLLILDLSGNLLTKLPRDFEQLTELVQLSLGGNRFEVVPSELWNLVNLVYLGINDNHLTALPANIGKLNKLELLFLGSFGIIRYLNNVQLPINEIVTLPPEIGELSSLKLLEASYCAISSLPPEIKNLRNLENLILFGNPLPIPPEILEKSKEPAVILDFYFYRRKRSLSESKILVVGQGSVGKTSLVHQILHNTFDQNQPKTEGISIKQWTIDDRQQTISAEVDSQSVIKLNIWDFGGQEIMHATHQFFLTKRSLYLLVLDARLTQEENRVEYWLKIIQSFGGESPVLIVGNKTDQHPLDIDRTGLQKKYPNIVGILETSAATGAGIEDLKSEIAKQMNTLPHVRDLLPETWFTVKSSLEELAKNKNFFTHDEYLGLCDTNKVTDETSQHTLIGFLHDLGVVLHFQDDPRLEALGILNPQWVTNGVYKILNSHELFQNQGTLTIPLLNHILNLREYPSNKRLFIVDMMKKFELCYDIEPDKSFLIPDLLPKDEPFTGEWESALAFHYHYYVLPTSIITRFIVRMNSFIHKTVWRSGVVLKKNGNVALVKADTEDKNMYIRVSGDQNTRRDFLSMIRGELEAIHKTIAKIEAAEKVPIPNYQNADPVDYKLLLQLERKGVTTHHVQSGNQLIEVNVRALLNGIEPEKVRVEKGATLYIGGDVSDSTITIGDDNMISITKNIFKPIYRAIGDSAREESEREDLIADVREIENEVLNGDQIDESFLSRRLRNLKKMAPDIADVALSALTGPGTAVSMIVKKVATKIKSETK